MLSIANFLTFCDKMSRVQDSVTTLFGTAASHPAGTLYQYAQDLETISVGSNDYDIETDLNTACRSFKLAFDASTTDSYGQSTLYTLMTGLDTHFSNHGTELVSDGTVSDTATFLAYYNGGSGSGTSVYDNQVIDTFGDLYSTLTGTSLTASNVFKKSYHPYINSSYTNGMGTRAVGGAFTDGQSITSASYAAALMMVEITANFSGGTGLPTVTIAGTDDTGATTTTWSVTLDSNNPVSAVSTTVTPAITAGSRQVVAVASASGIVPGSVMKINSGLVDEEVFVVEAVAGTNITGAFLKAHSAGAALTGLRTYATTPSVAGRRCVDVSNITIGITGHSAGTVRVFNRQTRGVV